MRRGRKHLRTFLGFALTDEELSKLTESAMDTPELSDVAEAASEAIERPVTEIEIVHAATDMLSRACEHRGGGRDGDDQPPTRGGRSTT